MKTVNTQASDVKALYNERILELAKDIPLTERLDDAQASARKVSPLCGSRVTVDLVVEDGKVARFGQEVRSCTLGQASASLFARHVLGSTPAELRDLKDRVEAMLKKGGAAPEGEWADLELLSPAAAFKSRHGSILLPFQATVAALDEIEEKKGSA